MRSLNKSNTELKASVAEIVSNLFKDGMTPCKKYGIDAQRIEDVERRHPHVSKQYPSAQTTRVS